MSPRQQLQEELVAYLKSKNFDNIIPALAPLPNGYMRVINFSRRKHWDACISIIDVDKLTFWCSDGTKGRFDDKQSIINLIETRY